jgi:HD-like signal output (HDOD) protein
MRSFITRSLQQSKSFRKFDFEELWQHSYLVSVCAESFAGDDDPQQRGVLLTLGLLHDIGKFALIGIGLAMKEKNLIPHVPGNIHESTCLLEKEERLFGINHPIVGGILALKWNLSERFCTVLEYHHYPSFFDWDTIPSEYEHEIAILSLADYIVNTFFETKNYIPEPAEKAYQTVDIEPSIDSILTVDLREKLLNAREFFGLLK